MAESVEQSEIEEKSSGVIARISEKLSEYIFYSFDTFKGFIAFTLISLGVLIKKFGKAKCVIYPLIQQQIRRCGVSLLPIVIFLSLALGFLVVGQTVALLSRFGVKDLAGVLMVAAVVRELGPIAAAFIIMARVGTAIVIELSTSRALGEVETLEALGIDPVHYFVIPRLIGVISGTISLTVYLVIGALLSGYFFAFIQDVPLEPWEYLKQIGDALIWSDFLLIFLKACGFGLIISVTACYYGLAKPLNLNMISKTATSAIMQSIIGCVLLDGILIFIYFVMLS